MRITKFVHSCLLAQEGDRTVLFDPGSFTWENGQFDLTKIVELDRIAITHNHPDHCHPDFIRALLNKFPSAQIVCNHEVQNTLETAGISATFRGDETNCLKPFVAPHESIVALGGVAPLNNGFHFKELLSNPGDSLSFNETKKILAVPFTSPWGSVTQAVDRVVALKPEKVFLIHDWHWSEDGKKWLAEKLFSALSAHGIEFVDLKLGESHEV